MVEDAGTLVRNNLGTPRTSEAAEVGTPDILAVVVVVVGGTHRTVALMGIPVAVVEDMDIRTLGEDTVLGELSGNSFSGFQEEIFWCKRSQSKL